MKSCENCYYKFENSNIKWCLHEKEEPKALHICDEYGYNCEKCGYELAEYEINGRKLCSSCALEILGVENEFVTKYYIEIDDECYKAIGDDSEDDIADIIERASEYSDIGIKKISSNMF